MISKRVTAAILVAAFAAVGAIVAAPAMAATAKYDSWVEDDNFEPLPATHALVFYQNSSINFGHKTEGVNERLTSLADLDGLAYTVSESFTTANAGPPSYQIDVVNDTTKVTYARLVWVPAAQVPNPGAVTGEYVDLEKGKWFAGSVWTDGHKSTPFGSGAGSIVSAQPLSFFEDFFGADAKVDFFGLTQGSTNDVTSTVTSLTFEGSNVPLGTVDKTPFDSSDVDVAVAQATSPLTAKLADLQKEFDAYKVSHPLTTTGGAQEGFVNTRDAAKAKWNLVDKSSLVATQNAEANAKAKIVSISGTEKAGKTVTAETQSMSGASHSYAWYVGGKLVKHATKSTLKLTRSNAHHALSVWVTTSWTDANGAKHSTTAKSKYLRTAYIAR